ncbi:MAG: hypothetical protein RBT33_01135 [Candidatus Dojkabacteria bacterium]|jgi:hypothetical protein|nr:hypothetical protein [Candidatus Dojkabacteria bacterium]
MQRGILELTKEEVSELLKNLDLSKYEGTPLHGKLSSLNDSSINPQECKILLSEDELETLMDEIGFVDQSTNTLLFSTMQKITNLMNSFRE